ADGAPFNDDSSYVTGCRNGHPRADPITAHTVRRGRDCGSDQVAASGAEFDADSFACETVPGCEASSALLSIVWTRWRAISADVFLPGRYHMRVQLSAPSNASRSRLRSTSGGR